MPTHTHIHTYTEHTYMTHVQEAEDMESLRDLDTHTHTYEHIHIIHIYDTCAGGRRHGGSQGSSDVLEHGGALSNV